MGQTPLTLPRQSQHHPLKLVIKKEGFELVQLNPQLTKEKIKYLYQINQMQKIGEFFLESEIKEQVKNEIEFFNKIKPACVVTGFDLSLCQKLLYRI